MVGAAAGGVETVSRLVSLLPRDLPAAVFVVVHFPSESMSILPPFSIVNKRCRSLTASRFEERGENARRRAELIRRVWLQSERIVSPEQAISPGAPPVLPSEQAIRAQTHA